MYFTKMNFYPISNLCDLQLKFLIPHVVRLQLLLVMAMVFWNLCLSRSKKYSKLEQIQIVEDRKKLGLPFQTKLKAKAKLMSSCTGMFILRLFSYLNINRFHSISDLQNWNMLLCSFNVFVQIEKLAYYRL